MNAPAGMQSSEEHQQSILQYLESHCEEEKSGKGYTCKECGSEIQQTTMHVSIHDNRFSGCTGGGNVKTAALPYCPICEGVPKRTSTCVHV